ncbi:GntG family PLP-dependent aldolase [Sporomusa termitida]|uniref:L-allo-threonine aldolase n=1 Tax=Sporomusa termitida TaxID=2377 RepID=A0A517DUP9_9FIRM|nr:GntG family PLP-dependent aldolase [Sporomusa termitida]QDR81082.1 L-allo-threonine aldolase [Sporomusa termitida]
MWKDFRSDTVTQPTPAMRQAMMAAVVGDDTLGEDPTVKKLELLSAAMFGKEAALLTVSGTMANQIAIMALTQLGDEIIVGEEAHMYNLEVGALAALACVQARPLPSQEGRFAVSDIKKSIRPRGVQSPVSRVLCLENTYDLNRGYPLPPAYQAEMAQLARNHGLAVYLDGARIFNAAAALQCDLKELAQDVDALQFCLTKGLAAPFGSMLVGSQAFIEKARWIKQRLGGGLRQAGHMAAAGIIALETMRERLHEDHANACRLANALAAIDERLVNVKQVKTNVVQLDFEKIGKEAAWVTEALLQQQIKVKPIGPYACRMITHWGITAGDVDYAAHAIQKIIK